MKNEINYYLSIIKPIEKKYNRFCILYNLTKINYFKMKKEYYNNKLNNYYQMLLKYKKYTKNLEQQLVAKKSS